MAKKYSIEMSDAVPTASYGVIHKTGCRNLRDDYELGEHENKSDAAAEADNLLGWGMDGEYEFAPCAK